MDLQPTTQISRSIKVLHIEPTDVCQAACPLCARETDTDFDKNIQHHLTVSQIKEQFSEDFIRDLDKMFMCGNYGDPAAGRYTLDIYRYFRKINPNIVLGMNTNGGIRDTDWWRELASILSNPLDYVVFSIDGLEDTNHVYRRNVNWAKVQENAQSFIAAGGIAHWDMLIYRHNEHQIDSCRDLAKSMGFYWFRAKVSKRPLTGELKFPLSYRTKKLATSKIDCHALNEQSIYLDAQSRVSPCCWLGSRQKDFVDDFDLIRASWETKNPDLVCQDTCGSMHDTTNFKNQWRVEERLK